MHCRVVSRPEDLARCLAVRRTVFIEEQGVPEDLEIDGEDDRCTHVLALDDDGVAVGTARLKRLGDATMKAQRVAVLKPGRRRGIGRIIMGELEAEARRQGAQRVSLGSQVSAIPFYERLGYVADGPVYDDAGIPHRDMHKAL